jgi:hypothetical protein
MTTDGQVVWIRCVQCKGLWPLAKMAIRPVCQQCVERSRLDAALAEAK